MVSVQSSVFQEPKSGANNTTQPPCPQEELERQALQEQFAQHKWWDRGKGWNNLLNNLRLIIQPAVFSCLLAPWLAVFTLPALQQGLRSLSAVMNNFQGFVPV
jgi:hypothetical protein